MASVGVSDCASGCGFNGCIGASLSPSCCGLARRRLAHRRPPSLHVPTSTGVYSFRSALSRAHDQRGRCRAPCNIRRLPAVEQSKETNPLYFAIHRTADSADKLNERRVKLIALICIEALAWFASIALQTFPGGHIELGTSALIPVFQLVSLALLFLPAVLIGMASRQWQAALTLNMIVILPAVALGAVTPAYQRPPFGLQGFTLFAVIAALGLFGWLLRFARAEFGA
jgi:hypothetical protein